MNIYCISGLGADQRIFQKLHIPGASLVPVNWPPYDKYDDMTRYAQKIIAQIPEENPVLLGVSFGGMLAVEIARQVPVSKAIIISSAGTCDELPPMNRFIRFMIRIRIIPVGILKHFHWLLANRFGAATGETRKLIADIMKDTDNGFVKWAVHALFAWQNHEVPSTVFHIHGTADRIIPPDKIKPDRWVEGGTHFMVYDRAAEISDIIAAQLAE